MSVLLPMCGARGDVEPMAGLAMRSWELGTEVCAPRDSAELLARVGVPLVPIGAWP